MYPQVNVKEKQGVVSTEILFQIYENGSTAGRIQRNRGTFVNGYNLSVESSLLMAAYLTYMRDIGIKEFNLGNMTDDDVRDLFYFQINPMEPAVNPTIRKKRILTNFGKNL